MMLRRQLAASLFLMVVSISIAAEQPSDVEFFENKIRPVLVQHCYECHAADSKPLQAGLRLDTRQAMRQGGESGSAVIPGNANESLLVAALKYDGFEMPPKGRLSDEVVKDFEKWIDMGAPDPREDDGEVTAAEPTIDFEKAAQFWSFQPPVKSPLPTVQNSAWLKNEIDNFVLARLEQEGLKPVRPANKRELIRRVTFDLIGLPPTPDEIAEFTADDSPDAYPRLIERLLKSAHYGERWGRYWLDVARYADDQAHTFGVKANTEAWRYRQWVIEALNADMPYDDFVRLQIAGDQLDEAHGFDRYVALGYFGLGAVYYKNSDKAKAEADELDDRVDTLTRGFLGLTVSCARCHDHKFDPIPTADYYSLAGIFNSSPLKTVPLVDSEIVRAYDKGQEQVKQAEKALADRTRAHRESQAEACVDQVSQYVQAIWKQRVAKAKGMPLPNGKLAKETGLSESAIAKWGDFLSTGKKDKHEALAAWHALPEPKDEASIDSVPDEVKQVADSIQTSIQEVLNERDGKPNAASVNKSPATNQAVFTSLTINTSQLSVKIDVEINGARELYLVITDGGDGKSCDHADWVEPKLITADGEKQLTELKWRSAHTGYGSINLNHGVNGGTLRIGDQTYENGIGTHAPCVIAYDLPEGVQRFQAIAGLDHSGSSQGSATVKFMVFTSAPPASLTEESDEEATKPNEKKLSKAKLDLLKDVFGDGGLFRQTDDQFKAALTPEHIAELDSLQQKLDDAKAMAPPKYPAAHAISDGNPRDSKVFIRGNPARPGDVAPRQFLRVLAGSERSPYTAGSGRRELADDIASETNPLTARVIVNRVWQQHFGRGIVGTASNFGMLGEPPTHPELLDWLAVDFMEHGWSLKHLHRTIMLSATYTLSSEHDPHNSNLDGDARLLWRMNRRRLDVEAWRDALLAVSGNLDQTIGGENVPLTGNRRTVYTKVSRHELDDLLRLFDFPDANVTSEKRTATTVPQQQLFVLNGKFFIQQASALSKKLKSEYKADEDRIHAAFQRLYGRSPTDRELKIGLDFLSIAEQDESQQKIDAWQQYAQALLSLNEFMYID